MKRKITSGITMGALFLSAVAPVWAADLNVVISDNGAKSDNTVTVESKCEQKVDQKTETDVNLGLTVKGNTGGNNASGNVGSGVSVDTGAVSNTVSVFVDGGNNTAELPNCCCGSEEALTEVKVKDNGYRSTNEVTLKSEKKSEAKQGSKTKLNLTASVKGKTGKNKAKNNVGGTVEVKTDDVDNTVAVHVTGGANSL